MKVMISGFIVFHFLFILTFTAFGQASNPKELVRSESGLAYSVLMPGSGEKAREGNTVLIRETVTYPSGLVLYSNEQTGDAIPVTIGAGQAIDGLDEGLRGMSKGEVRQLFIPYYLAKRRSYPDHISPDSNLVVKLILEKIL